MSPVARILNPPLISTNIYLGLSSHLGLDVNSCDTNVVEFWSKRLCPRPLRSFSSSRVSGKRNRARVNSEALAWFKTTERPIYDI
uniref:Ovule protein n=1 Tax=Mesocestoides corti TaxID=53468 RepID=A0A5K3FWR9_MESCO